MNNDKCDQELLMEEYEKINKAISATDSNVTHEYSDQELHQMCIVALKELVAKMYPGDQPKVLPKIDWLIRMLEKRFKE